jgi:hypothetical protein
MGATESGITACLAKVVWRALPISSMSDLAARLEALLRLYAAASERLDDDRLVEQFRKDLQSLAPELGPRAFDNELPNVVSPWIEKPHAFRRLRMQRFACRLAGWKRTNEATSPFGTANTTWCGSRSPVIPSVIALATCYRHDQADASRRWPCAGLFWCALRQPVYEGLRRHGPRWQQSVARL